MISRRLAACAALAVLALSPAAFAQAPAGAFASDVSQTVKVKQGALKGTVKDAIAYHLGIPYAAAPVGELRWKPPAAGPGWSGERDASAPGASCQAEEDCLFLNVVRPAGAKAGDKLPVMVWIHGGAYVIGTSMGAFGGDTEGTNFAKRGIVHVSLNYRLGRAGWFAHPALTREGPTGNYGMMDQVAALQWVRDNIAAFGGDPANVTIYGESAGGVSVHYLMLAPQAKGLFAKAIGQSSFARHVPKPLAKAEAKGVQAAKAAGVEGVDAAAAAALRKLPLASLPYTGGFVGRAGPILDGTYITGGIAQGYAAGRQAKVPLMIGGNSNEASLFRPQPALLDSLPETARAAVSSAFDPEGTGDKARIVHALQTAQLITEPDRNLARLHAGAGQPTWLYYFSYVPPSKAAQKPYGAAHTDEIRFVFGAPRAGFAPEDLPLSGAMNELWANFAKTGAPGAAWPKFLPGETSVEFGNDGVQVRREHLKARLDLVEAMQPK